MRDSVLRTDPFLVARALTELLDAVRANSTRSTAHAQAVAATAIPRRSITPLSLVSVISQVLGESRHTTLRPLRTPERQVA
jgi:hypothetical protein